MSKVSLKHLRLVYEFEVSILIDLEAHSAGEKRELNVKPKERASKHLGFNNLVSLTTIFAVHAIPSTDASNNTQKRIPT